jgi:hypothetical protein
MEADCRPQTARLHLPEQLRTANDIGCAHRFGIKLAQELILRNQEN